MEHTIIPSHKQTIEWCKLQHWYKDDDKQNKKRTYQITSLLKVCNDVIKFSLDNTKYRFNTINYSFKEYEPSKSLSDISFGLSLTKTMDTYCKINDNVDMFFNFSMCISKEQYVIEKLRDIFTLIRCQYEYLLQDYIANTGYNDYSEDEYSDIDDFTDNEDDVSNNAVKNNKNRNIIKHKLKPYLDRYFINIIDGNYAHKYKLSLIQLSELDKYKAIRKYVFIGDSYTFINDYYPNTIKNL